jgi:membrane protease YdiL (CAAX protease family)
MHIYPVAFPYAFLFGLAAGYVRRATGSTSNTILMHVMNNVLLLTLGLNLFGR